MILPYLDSVGMNLKLPSVSAESQWQEHAKFLELCHMEDLHVFVKIIISEKTDPSQLEVPPELLLNTLLITTIHFCKAIIKQKINLMNFLRNNQYIL
jgi:hypothetical protein